jgi:preprotein translocase subunit YajC
MTIAFLFALLDTTTTTAKTKSSASSSVFLIVLILLVAVYFLVLRPRQRRARGGAPGGKGKALEVGDEVISAGGILGRITAITGDEIDVEVAPGTTLTFWRRAVNLRSAVAGAPQSTNPPEPAGVEHYGIDDRYDDETYEEADDDDSSTDGTWPTEWQDDGAEDTALADGGDAGAPGAAPGPVWAPAPEQTDDAQPSGAEGGSGSRPDAPGGSGEGG